MYVRKKNEEAVSPVIAVILMVAITVVLAGVLYVWVTSLADTSSTTTTALGVSAKDAAAQADVAAVVGPPAVPAHWTAGVDFIVVEHLTGAQIDWSKLITGIKVKSINSDIQYALTVKTVKGSAYAAPGTATPNYLTSPGDNVILAFPAGYTWATGGIIAGDSVILTINGNNQQFKSPGTGFIVN
jgi:flagellin-like protein